MLPNQKNLDQINWKIKHITNKQGEYKRKIHYGCYLLGYKSGLRVSEAINFDLTNQTKNGLYRITKTKGKKERLVYISPQVINELKKNDWKPNQTNRFNFYHFLKKIKREVNLPAGVELTPHTLRRSFTTHHAEAGLSLPILQKLLGHSSIRTTALYWQNTYNDDPGSDPSTMNNILLGKKWLENREKEPSKLPSAENFPSVLKNSEPIIKDKPVITNYQPKPAISQIPPRPQGEFISKKIEISKQLPVIANEKKQPIKEQILLEKIKKLGQTLANEQEKRTIAENNLATQKQTNDNLHQQLREERKINTNLTQKIQVYEQNYTNLQTAYQNTLKDKENTQKQLNHLTAEIKKAAQQFYQWQKVNYYQRLEKEQRELKAQIVQPPPWKN